MYSLVEGHTRHFWNIYIKSMKIGVFSIRSQDQEVAGWRFRTSLSKYYCTKRVVMLGKEWQSSKVNQSKLKYPWDEPRSKFRKKGKAKWKVKKGRLNGHLAFFCCHPFCGGDSQSCQRIPLCGCKFSQSPRAALYAIHKSL